MLTQANLWIWFKQIYIYTERRRETSHEYWTSFVGSDWMHTSLCTVCHCWIIDPPRCNLHLSGWAVVLLSTSPGRNTLFTAAARQFSGSWLKYWSTSYLFAGLTLFYLHLLYLHSKLNGQLESRAILSLPTGSRSSMTGTTTCWEWRRLPSATRACSPVWRRTAWGSWRPRPRSQSEVHNTCARCYFSPITSHITTLREATDHWGYYSHKPIWNLDWQCTP